MIWDIQTLLIVAGTFLVAGMVKGIVGFGLPTVAIAVLAASIGLTPAMALVIVPVVVTNVWQAMAGGALVPILRRFWPLLLSACLGIWLGVLILARVDATYLAGLLGVLLCIYATLGLCRITLPPPQQRERWLSPALGLVNGLLSGMTGTFVMPSMLYFQALALPRDVLVQTMGVLFTVSMAAIAASMAGESLISDDIGLMSACAVAPALLGMVLGRSVRQRMSDAAFRRLLYVALLLLGFFLAVEPFHA